MKAIQILSKVFFVITLPMLSTFCFSQISITEAISKAATTPVPFNATKRVKGLGVSGIINSNHSISDKLYDNVQLTQYTSASAEPELDAVFFRKFAIPNSNRTLIVVSFGHNYGGWNTHVLCVVNPDGTIVSTLDGTISGAEVYVKQFRINAQNKIIVTTIHPETTISIPFKTFTSFVGGRRDIAYSVNAQGQFVQESIVVYKSKTYTRSYLEDESVNLWEGGEIPEQYGRTTKLNNKTQ